MAKKTQLKYKPGTFFSVRKEWMESSAFRDLKPVAKSLLFEFNLISTPSLNGQIVLPTARAARLIGVAENTVMPAFDALLEHGFIELCRGEMWVQRKAREWRLTTMECKGREATDDWKRWEPDKPVVITRRTRNKS